MTHTVTQKITAALEQQWNIVESYLLAPSQLPEFKNYLKGYRGRLFQAGAPSTLKNELGQKSVEGLLNFFISLFLQTGVGDLTPEEMNVVLSEVEQNINLALYYWYGLNDKNYQWKTWLHFFNCDGAGCVFLNSDQTQWGMVLTEYGIYLGEVPMSRLAKTLPISKSLVFKNAELLPFSTFSQKQVFARLRTIQREVCAMTEEWEYQNSILAVEYGHSISLLESQNSPQNEQNHLNFLSHMDTLRNSLAAWCLESLCDFQRWINTSDMSIQNEDILGEIDALCGLLLSALQKIFLPASVSRLVYNPQVIALFEAFAKERLIYCSDDFSAKLLMQALQSAQGQKFNLELFDVLKQKPFEWKLCFDPSAALKSFCWAYSQKHHFLLCALLGVCYFKKCFSQYLDENSLIYLENAFEMQSVFLEHTHKSLVPDMPEHEISASTIETLTQSLLNYLNTMVKPSEQNEDLVKFLKNYLTPLSETKV